MEIDGIVLNGIERRTGALNDHLDAPFIGRLLTLQIALHQHRVDDTRE
jgi:hypothetical protein